MEPAPGRKANRFHPRDSIIDEFRSSSPNCKGFKGHPRQAAQKMIEWETIPEQGIGTEVLAYALSNSRSTGNALTSQLLGSQGPANTILGLREHDLVLISWMEGTASG